PATFPRRRRSVPPLWQPSRVAPPLALSGAHELKGGPEPRVRIAGGAAHVVLRAPQRVRLARSVPILKPVAVKAPHEQVRHHIGHAPQRHQHAPRALGEERSLQADRPLGLLQVTKPRLAGAQGDQFGTQGKRGVVQDLAHCQDPVVPRTGGERHERLAHQAPSDGTYRIGWRVPNGSGSAVRERPKGRHANGTSASGPCGTITSSVALSSRSSNAGGSKSSASVRAADSANRNPRRTTGRPTPSSRPATAPNATSELATSATPSPPRSAPTSAASESRPMACRDTRTSPVGWTNHTSSVSGVTR